MKSSLIDTLRQRAGAGSERFMLGICGAPGAGKSTLAEWIVSEWNKQEPNTAVLVPMDGYHLSNESLEEKSLLQLKGIPDTFDAVSFVDKLDKIKKNPRETHFCPRFERSIEASIQDAISVNSTHRLVLTEGNYLLLDKEPWSRIREILDEVWMIEAEEELILPRLLARHQAGGKTADAALAKVNSTDLPNARLVAQSGTKANRRFKASELQG
jgi:pantothenate kinase